MSTLNCPNCGAAVEPELACVRMSTCTSCGTALLLNDAVVQVAGHGGIMHGVPLLFGLGDDVRIGHKVFHVRGHVRYSYGRGTWDEFWCTDADDDPVWISIDEGDVAVQRATNPPSRQTKFGGYRVGEGLAIDRDDFTVVEVETAECIAVQGQFDEVIHVGDTHKFVNAQGLRGHLLSGETWDGGEKWFLGRWHDPFDIKVQRL